MSLEVNPTASAAAVQQASSYTPPTPPADDSGGVDSRRYTKFDRTATDAGTAHMSFGDFLDMINPLEHIPVVSSVYRAVTGDTINPVSRVAGDILYGGAMGAASAIFSGVSAVADAGLEQKTGMDSGGLVIAALFGKDSDKDNSVQVADAGKTAPSPASAPAPVTLADAGAIAPVSGTAASVLQSPVKQKIEVAQTATTAPITAALAVTGGAQDADPSAPNMPTADALAAQASAATKTAAAPTQTPTTTSSANAIKLASAVANADGQSLLGGISLANVKTTNKQPYGGVMGPTFSNSNAPDMTVPLAQSNNSVRMGQTIYPNRFMGAHTFPPTSSNAAKSNAPSIPVTDAPSFTPVSSTTPGGKSSLPVPGQPLPSGALQDMMLKAISQYKNAASAGGGVPSLNFTN